MKKIGALFFGLIIVLASCEDDDPPPFVLEQGTYTGTFSRSSPYSKSVPSKVTLTIDENRFSGESEIAKQPAICHGTFSISGSKIEFVNGCAWTAEFDWTFILDGTYDISRDGNSIVISRSYDGEVNDTYVLTKQ